MSATLLTRCLVCGSEDLVGYVDLGDQPVAGSFHHGVALPRFPLAVNLCGCCFHSQLSCAVDPIALGRNDVFLGEVDPNQRLRLRALAEDALAWTGAQRVLDASCADGALLEALRALGCEVVGADRAAARRELARAKGFEVLSRPWGTAAAAELQRSGAPRFDLVVATDALVREREPTLFLIACADALAPGGTIVLDVPYAPAARPRHELDLPRHEVLSYFLVRSFTLAARRAGLVISHVQDSDLEPGRSLRFFLREPTASLAHCDAVRARIEAERERGLHDPSGYASVQSRIEASGRALQRLVADARQGGRAVVGWGASARASALLGRFPLPLDRLVDPDASRWGFLVPGSDQRIASPDALAGVPGPLALVVLTGEPLDEVRRQVIAIRGTRTGDTFVVCAPALREVPTWAPPLLMDMFEAEPKGGMAS